MALIDSPEVESFSGAILERTTPDVSTVCTSTNSTPRDASSACSASSFGAYSATLSSNSTFNPPPGNDGAI